MNLSRSQLMVLFGCIPLRIFIAYISTKIPKEYLRLFAIPLLAIGVGFLVTYFKRLRMTPPESGTGKAWWSDLRLIHGMLYLTAAVYALQQKPTVWIPLTIDIIFGILVFMVHYSI